MRPRIRLILACTLFTACNPPDHHNHSCPQWIQCTKKNTGIKLEGYTEQETATIIVTAYLKDGTFQQVKDSVIFEDEEKILLASECDYDIYIPAADKHHKISALVQPADSGFIYRGCAGSGKTPPGPTCSYTALSGLVDGVLTKPFSQKNGYAFIITK